MMFLRTNLTAFAFASVVIASLSHATPGQPGTLDETFGALGKVTTAIGSGNDTAQAIAVQPDGKILVAGGCITGSTYDFCLARYSPAGILDTSFGAGGIVITAIGSNHSNATALALQPDGKIVITGNCFSINSDFCLARYNAVGALDATFGAGGKVITAIGSKDDGAVAVAVQPDGKIVVAGGCLGAINGDFCLARYNAVGTLDTTFGADGKVITAIGSGTAIPHDLALQADGKIIVAGHCLGTINNDFCLARYDTVGMLDTSFGTGGAVITAAGGGEDYIWALAVQPDGKIVAGGNCNSSSSGPDFCLARYTTVGALDSTFGTGGMVTSSIVGGSSDYVRALALQPDGKIVVAGYCSVSKISFCLARYNPVGALDTTFGTLGKVVSAIGSRDDQALALALQPDGKIVVAGACAIGDNRVFCIARYEGGPFISAGSVNNVDTLSDVLTVFLVGFMALTACVVGFDQKTRRALWD